MGTGIAAGLSKSKTSMQKFNERKAKGLIPKTAKIGDGIAIHATRPQRRMDS